MGSWPVGGLGARGSLIEGGQTESLDPKYFHITPLSGFVLKLVFRFVVKKKKRTVSPATTTTNKAPHRVISLFLVF